MKNKKSFFQRLAGNIIIEDEDDSISDNYDTEDNWDNSRSNNKIINRNDEYEESDDTEAGELTVDVYQTPKDIIIEAMIAGVKPDDLHIHITRDTVTIQGKRESNQEIGDDDYFYKELFWGEFSRTILLPSEVDIDNAEAIEKHGLLLLRLPKLDKGKQSKIKVKSI